MLDAAELKDPLLYIPNNLMILTKDSQLVPMQLWEPQRHYLEHRTHKDVCLKNRQQGFSTAVLAGNAHTIFTRPYQQGVIITHDEETSTFLLMTIDRFYRNLPHNRGKRKQEWLPQRSWSSGSRMRFPELDTYLYIDSAKSDSIGIGHTLSICHLSELAKWPPKKAHGLFADVTQAVPPTGWITVESTPRGRGGKFYELYMAAKGGEVDYQAFFYPWWWDQTCVRPAPKKLRWSSDEQDLARYALKTDNQELSDEQIAFRREKLADLRDLFFQEYPENDVECWLSSDLGVFDGVALRQYYLDRCTGKKEGNLEIWKDVVGGEKYVIGVDAASGAPQGDYLVAAVLSVKRNEYVARLRAKIPPDIFAMEVLRLGTRYNDAEIGVERTGGHGAVVLHILLDEYYPNIHYHVDYDAIIKDRVLQPGWKTSRMTKPIMVDALAAAVRSHDIQFWSENLIDECSSYIWQANETAGHGPGQHDDELDAVMIALQVRERAPVENALMEARRPKIESYAPSW